MANNTVFGVENLVALYMVCAKVDKVSTKELSVLNEFISKKMMEHDKKVTTSEKFGAMLLFSDFYIEKLKDFKPQLFNISDLDTNGDRQISCSLPLDESLKHLKQDILAISFDKNPRFMEATANYTREFMKTKHLPVKKKKEKKLTQEEADERWYRYFGC